MDKLTLIALKKSGSTDVSAAVAAKVAAQAAQSAAETAQAAAEDAAEDAVEALASEYSTSSTYAVGDYCVKDGVLYRCTTAISTAESWTAAHWTATKVTTELASDYSSLKSQISAMGLSVVEGKICVTFEEVA